MCIFICLIENINVLCDVLYMRMQLTDFFKLICSAEKNRKTLFKKIIYKLLIIYYININEDYMKSINFM